MTNEQLSKLYEVEKNLNDCRRLLDEVMYYMDRLPDNEYTKIRAAYDYICKALDQM